MVRVWRRERGLLEDEMCAIRSKKSWTDIHREMRGIHKANWETAEVEFRELRATGRRRKECIKEGVRTECYMRVQRREKTAIMKKALMQKQKGNAAVCVLDVPAKTYLYVHCAYVDAQMIRWGESARCDV